LKRFWKGVAVVPGESGLAIHLDGRPVRTPARELLLLPTERLAEAVADEWRSVGEQVDPRAMPLTGLANAAIDHVKPDPERFARDLAKYAEADLTCYRAEGPAALIDRQEELWGALLAWARRRFDVDFYTTRGLLHVAQPKFTVERLSSALLSLNAFQLAAMSPLVTIGGSLIAALAVLEGKISPGEAWAAVSIDDRWQLEQWGMDAEAVTALKNRERDFMSATRFLALLDG
jgi:chaperone required for assembly of F1-ATPase